LTIYAKSEKVISNPDEAMLMSDITNQNTSKMPENITIGYV
jgi:hypothetical protein